MVATFNEILAISIDTSIWRKNLQELGDMYDSFLKKISGSTASSVGREQLISQRVAIEKDIDAINKKLNSIGHGKPGKNVFLADLRTEVANTTKIVEESEKAIKDYEDSIIRIEKRNVNKKAYMEPINAAGEWQGSGPNAGKLKRVALDDIDGLKKLEEEVNRINDSTQRHQLEAYNKMNKANVILLAKTNEFNSAMASAGVDAAKLYEELHQKQIDLQTVKNELLKPSEVAPGVAKQEAKVKSLREDLEKLIARLKELDDITTSKKKDIKPKPDTTVMPTPAEQQALEAKLVEQETKLKNMRLDREKARAVPLSDLVKPEDIKGISKATEELGRLFKIKAPESFIEQLNLINTTLGDLEKKGGGGKAFEALKSAQVLQEAKAAEVATQIAHFQSEIAASEKKLADPKILEQQLVDQRLILQTMINGVKEKSFVEQEYKDFSVKLEKERVGAINALVIEEIEGDLKAAQEKVAIETQALEEIGARRKLAKGDKGQLKELKAEADERKKVLKIEREEEETYTSQLAIAKKQQEDIQTKYNDKIISLREQEKAALSIAADVAIVPASDKEVLAQKELIGLTEKKLNGYISENSVLSGLKGQLTNYLNTQKEISASTTGEATSLLKLNDAERSRYLKLQELLSVLKPYRDLEDKAIQAREAGLSSTNEDIKKQEELVRLKREELELYKKGGKDEVVTITEKQKTGTILKNVVDKEALDKQGKVVEGFRDRIKAVIEDIRKVKGQQLLFSSAKDDEIKQQALLISGQGELDKLKERYVNDIDVEKAKLVELNQAMKAIDTLNTKSKRTKAENLQLTNLRAGVTANSGVAANLEKLEKEKILVDQFASKMATLGAQGYEKQISNVIGLIKQLKELLGEQKNAVQLQSELAKGTTKEEDIIEDVTKTVSKSTEVRKADNKAIKDGIYGLTEEQKAEKSALLEKKRTTNKSLEDAETMLTLMLKVKPGTLRANMEGSFGVMAEAFKAFLSLFGLFDDAIEKTSGKMSGLADATEKVGEGVKKAAQASKETSEGLADITGTKTTFDTVDLTKQAEVKANAVKSTEETLVLRQQLLEAEAIEEQKLAEVSAQREEVARLKAVEEGLAKKKALEIASAKGISASVLEEYRTLSELLATGTVYPQISSEEMKTRQAELETQHPGIKDVATMADTKTAEEVEAEKNRIAAEGNLERLHNEGRALGERRLLLYQQVDAFKKSEEQQTQIALEGEQGRINIAEDGNKVIVELLSRAVGQIREGTSKEDLLKLTGTMTKDISKGVEPRLDAATTALNAFKEAFGLTALSAEEFQTVLGTLVDKLGVLGKALSTNVEMSKSAQTAFNSLAETFSAGIGTFKEYSQKIAEYKQIQKEAKENDEEGLTAAQSDKLKAMTIWVKEFQKVMFENYNLFINSNKEAEQFSITTIKGFQKITAESERLNKGYDTRINKIQEEAKATKLVTEENLKAYDIARQNVKNVPITELSKGAFNSTESAESAKAKFKASADDLEAVQKELDDNLQAQRLAAQKGTDTKILEQEQINIQNRLKVAQTLYDKTIIDQNKNYRTLLTLRKEYDAEIERSARKASQAEIDAISTLNVVQSSVGKQQEKLAASQARNDQYNLEGKSKRISDASEQELSARKRVLEALEKLEQLHQEKINIITTAAATGKTPDLAGNKAEINEQSKVVNRALGDAERSYALVQRMTNEGSKIVRFWNQLRKNVIESAANILRFQIEWMLAQKVIDLAMSPITMTIDAIQQGIKYLGDFQNTAVEIREVLLQNARFSYDFATNIQLGTVAAEKTAKALMEMSTKVGVNADVFQQLFESFAQAGGLEAVGDDLDKAIKSVGLLSSGLGSVGINLRDARRGVSEFSKLLTGTSTARDAINRALRRTPEQLREIILEAYKEGNLYEQLEVLLKNQAYTLETSDQIYERLNKKIELYTDRARGAFAKEMFDAYLSALQSIGEWFDENGKEIFETLSQWGKVLVDTAGIVVEIVKDLYAVYQFGAAAGNALNLVYESGENAGKAVKALFKDGTSDAEKFGSKIDILEEKFSSLAGIVDLVISPIKSGFALIGLTINTVTGNIKTLIGAYKDLNAVRLEAKTLNEYVDTVEKGFKRLEEVDIALRKTSKELSEAKTPEEKAPIIERASPLLAERAALTNDLKEKDAILLKSSGKTLKTFMYNFSNTWDDETKKRKLLPDDAITKFAETIQHAINLATGMPQQLIDYQMSILDATFKHANDQIEANSAKRSEAIRATFQAGQMGELEQERALTAEQLKELSGRTTAIQAKIRGITGGVSATDTTAVYRQAEAYKEINNQLDRDLDDKSKKSMTVEQYLNNTIKEKTKELTGLEQFNTAEARAAAKEGFLELGLKVARYDRVKGSIDDATNSLKTFKKENLAAPAKSYMEEQSKTFRQLDADFKSKHRFETPSYGFTREQMVKEGEQIEQERIKADRQTQLLITASRGREAAIILNRKRTEITQESAMLQIEIDRRAAVQEAKDKQVEQFESTILEHQRRQKTETFINDLARLERLKLKTDEHSDARITIENEIAQLKAKHNLEDLKSIEDTATARRKESLERLQFELQANNRVRQSRTALMSELLNQGEGSQAGLLFQQLADLDASFQDKIKEFRQRENDILSAGLDQEQTASGIEKLSRERFDAAIENASNRQIINSQFVKAASDEALSRLDVLKKEFDVVNQAQQLDLDLQLQTASTAKSRIAIEDRISESKLASLRMDLTRAEVEANLLSHLGKDNKFYKEKLAIQGSINNSIEQEIRLREMARTKAQVEQSPYARGVGKLFGFQPTGAQYKKVTTYESQQGDTGGEAPLKAVTKFVRVAIDPLSEAFEHLRAGGNETTDALDALKAGVIDFASALKTAQAGGPGGLMQFFGKLGGGLGDFFKNSEWAKKIFGSVNKDGTKIVGIFGDTGQKIGGALGSIFSMAGPIAQGIGMAVQLFSWIFGRAARRIADDIKKDFDAIMAKFESGAETLGNTIAAVEEERLRAIRELSGKKGGQEQLDKLLPELEKQIESLKKQAKDLQQTFQQELRSLRLGSGELANFAQQWDDINKKVKEYADSFKSVDVSNLPALQKELADATVEKDTAWKELQDARRSGAGGMHQYYDEFTGNASQLEDSYNRAQKSVDDLTKKINTATAALKAQKEAAEFLQLSLKKLKEDTRGELLSAEKEAIDDALALNDLIQQRLDLIQEMTDAQKEYNQAVFDVQAGLALERRQSAAVKAASDLEKTRQDFEKAQTDRQKRLDDLNREIKVKQIIVDKELKIFGLVNDRAELQAHADQIELENLDLKIEKWQQILDIYNSIVTGDDGLLTITDTMKDLLKNMGSGFNLATNSYTFNNMQVSFNVDTGGAPFDGYKAAGEFTTYLDGLSRTGTSS